MMYRTTKSGFTLIETMVAIAIFSLAIVGPYTVAERSLVAADTARDELIASQLAQEGLEAVRYVRDTNYLAVYPNVSSWNPLTCLSYCTAPNKCTIDLPSVAVGTCSGISQCTNGVCPAMYLSSTGFYNEPPSGNTPGIGSPSRFTRTITITQNPNGGAQTGVELASSTVSWVTQGVQHSISLNEYFYDWF